MAWLTRRWTSERWMPNLASTLAAATLTISPGFCFNPCTVQYKVWFDRPPHEEVCMRIEQTDGDWKRLFCQTVDSRVWTDRFSMPGPGHYTWEVHSSDGKVLDRKDMTVLTGVQGQ